MEQHLGRKLEKGEIVHHIDMNKVNNYLSNLYLFVDRNAHCLSHYSLEVCGYALLGKKIWFNRDRKSYTTEPVSYKHQKMTQPMLDLISPKFIFKHKEKAARRRSRGETKGLLHVLLMKMIIGRELYANECVHHIDGNPDNNDINNLVLLTKKEHRKCHNDLQLCMIRLLNKEIYFDSNDGMYYLEKDSGTD